MGCSSSVVSPEGEIKQNEEKQNSSRDTDTNLERKQNGHLNSIQQTNKNNQQNGNALNKRLSVDRNANKVDPMSQAPVPKSVAFDVSFDGETIDGFPLKKKRPPRLQALEPLDVPKLTAEQLAEKQRVADEKRQRIKQKKLNASEKSSRRRRDILRAKEFSMKQHMEQEKNEINESIRQAEIKREQRLLEIKEKQRIREERAKRIRERAKRMQNPDDEVEVEKDEQFNAASDDSWLGNSEQNEKDENTDPQKRVGQHNLRNTVSASTVDSYDAAFMRERIPEHKVVQRDDFQNNLNDDDFFGS